jgi:hypothetical protein
MENAIAIPQYEIERGKPTPGFNHGSVQLNIGFEIKLHYKYVHRAVSELSLDLNDWESVPDICLYPYKPCKIKN